MKRIALPELGIGTAAIGNLYSAINDATAIETIEAAIAAGLRYFDTAPHYGFGLAERRLGAALDGVDAMLSTKVGRLLEPTAETGTRHAFVDADPFEPRFDYSADGIRRSYAASLRRLRRDRVDLLLAHDLGKMTHGADHARHMADFLDGGYRAMRDLKDAGAIDAIGIGVNEVEVCLDLIARVEIDVILLAGRYTLLDRSAEAELIPACAARGIALIIGGPYNSGILAQDDLSDPRALRYDYRPAPAPLIAEARALAACSARFGISLPAAALQFPLCNPAVDTVIAGVAGADQVHALIDRASAQIPTAMWGKMKALREAFA